VDNSARISLDCETAILRNIFERQLDEFQLAFIGSTIVSQYKLLEGERETTDLPETRVIVPTQLNEPILRLIHLISRERAARPIFDLRRRPLVSGTCPCYGGSRSPFASHHSKKGETNA